MEVHAPTNTFSIDPREIARRLYERLNVDQPPVDMRSALRILGFDVKFVRFPDEFKDFASLLDAFDKKIYISTEIRAFEQNFLMAYEAGNIEIFLDEFRSDVAKISGRLIRDLYIFNTERQKILFEFASALLIPASVLQKFTVHLTSDELSKLFVAPLTAIDHRIQLLKEGHI